ncbi:pentatricopeptide repeat-containing protein At2g13600-like [Magnolia sinica]|uniref:pentatricopeptide repeat-containing protein At2g13600-like n=1 Tax=Magnolia sinica TaxID=86752 RepID=UPI0026590EC3|nr:pentatricopeptide repeat-containing protein At2g13600-like [Magnolia sinica]
MASAIFKTTQNAISQNIHLHFSPKNSKSITKQSIPAVVVKLCSENRLKEAVGNLDFIPKEGLSAEKTQIYDCLLRSLASERDLILARKVYDHMVGSNLHRNVYFGTRIVHMFVECGSLVDAMDAFEGVEGKNLWFWSVILDGFCRKGLFDEALMLFRDFGTAHLRADGFVLNSVLRACGGSRNLQLGREVHGFVYKSGYKSDVFLSNCLVDMYGKCGCIGDARKLFDKMLHRDVVSWNTMLKGYSRAEDFDGFAGLVTEIEAGGVKPNLITWNTIISGYAVYGYAKEALDCFFKMQKMGMKPDVVSCNALISALARCGYFEEALELVRQMRNVGLEPDIASWTTLIGAYVNFGFLKEALSLFSQVQFSEMVLDEMVFSSVLKACAGLGALRQGREIHAFIVRNGFMIEAFLSASLVHMYTKCGKLDDAHRLLFKNNIVSWNSLIGGYVKKGDVEEAKELFQSLQSESLKPDLVSWNIMIDCNAQEGNTKGALDMLDRMQSVGVSPDSISWNSIIKGYAKGRQTDDAVQIVNRMESSGFKPNTGTWNTLISNHVNHGYGEEALQTFQLMKKCGIEPDGITISCILRACALLGASRIGKSVHGWIMRRSIKDKYITSALLEMYIKSDDLGTAWELFARTCDKNLVLWNGMISGFAKSGKLREAHRLLGKVRMAKLKPDVISWTAVLSGYIKSGNADTALEILCQMWQSGVRPDPIAITAASTACAKLGMLESGKEIHGFSITTGLEKDPSVQAALISMYFKCGSINEAVCIFERAPHNNTLIWNSMISGYVMHGRGKLAISLFRRMQNEGVDANSITFFGVLSACCQTNLVVEDWQCADTLLQDFGSLCHGGQYAEMVDIARDICTLEDGYLEHCGLLPSIYEAAKKFDGCVANSETRTKQSGLTKIPQPSWIYINRKRHRFDGGILHSEVDGTCEVFNALNQQMREASL